MVIEDRWFYQSISLQIWEVIIWKLHTKKMQFYHLWIVLIDSMSGGIVSVVDQWYPGIKKTPSWNPSIWALNLAEVTFDQCFHLYNGIYNSYSGW